MMMKTIKCQVKFMKLCRMASRWRDPFYTVSVYIYIYIYVDVYMHTYMYAYAMTYCDLPRC